MDRVSGVPFLRANSSIPTMSSVFHHTRRALTRATSSLAVLGLIATAGCNGDAATAPGVPTLPSIHKEVVDPSVTAPVLKRTKAIRVNRTNHFRVDQRGGWYSISEAGLYIYIPPNAVKAPITLSARALTGDLMAYEFGPHGTRFDVPLQMYQDLSLASIGPNTDLSKFEVGYFADETTLNYRTSNVSVNEFIPTGIVFQGHAVSFQVSHFSGYVIATGRGPDNSFE